MQNAIENVKCAQITVRVNGHSQKVNAQAYWLCKAGHTEMKKHREKKKEKKNRKRPLK